MFAELKQDGTIERLVENIPLDADPSMYRVVVDGAKPAKTTTLSWEREKDVSEWVVTATEAIRQWEEIIPPVSDFRGHKKALLDLMAKAEASAGITINFAPYGNMTFATDALNDMLACAYVCDVEIRGNPTMRDDMVDLALIDHSTVSVKCIHALAIVKEFCKTHRSRKLTLHSKMRATALATTIEQVTSI